MTNTIEWILICIALAVSPIDGARELYIFNQTFDTVEECKEYAGTNSLEIQQEVFAEIGPFAALCADKKAFETELLPHLEKENKLQNWI